MKKNLAAIACLLATGLQTACTDLNIKPMDGFVTIPISTDGSSCYVPTPDLPDLAKETCLAAKGLTGVPLICTDFPSAQTLVELKGAGWDFTSKCTAGWIVDKAKLQVSSFATFADNCIFTMQPMSPNDFAKYNSFTLSVVQTVDLNETKQKAQIMLGADDPPTRLIYQTTGTTPRQVTTIKIDKTALPNGGGTNTYQPLFKINSTAPAGGTYQIESIAVMGNNP
jgi:hypothetical protein